MHAIGQWEACIKAQRKDKQKMKKGIWKMGGEVLSPTCKAKKRNAILGASSKRVKIQGLVGLYLE